MAHTADIKRWEDVEAFLQGTGWSGSTHTHNRNTAIYSKKIGKCLFQVWIVTDPHDFRKGKADVFYVRPVALPNTQHSSYADRMNFAKSARRLVTEYKTASKVIAYLDSTLDKFYKQIQKV